MKKYLDVILLSMAGVLVYLARENSANKRDISVLTDVVNNNALTLENFVEDIYGEPLTDHVKERVYAGIEREIEGSNCNEENCILCQIVELERRIEQCEKEEDYEQAQAIKKTIKDLRREL